MDEDDFVHIPLLTFLKPRLERTASPSLVLVSLEEVQVQVASLRPADRKSERKSDCFWVRIRLWVRIKF